MKYYDNNIDESKLDWLKLINTNYEEDRTNIPACFAQGEYDWETKDCTINSNLKNCIESSKYDRTKCTLCEKGYILNEDKNVCEVGKCSENCKMCSDKKCLVGKKGEDDKNKYIIKDC